MRNFFSWAGWKVIFVSLLLLAIFTTCINFFFQPIEINIPAQLQKVDDLVERNEFSLAKIVLSKFSNPLTEEQRCNFGCQQREEKIVEREQKYFAQAITDLQIVMDAVLDLPHMINQTSYSGLTDELSVLRHFGSLANERSACSNPQVCRWAELLKKAMADVQQDVFPVVRQRFADYWIEHYKAEGIEVELKGAKKNVISFSHPLFASDSTIFAAYKQISKQLKLLRFERIVYKTDQKKSKGRGVRFDIGDEVILPGEHQQALADGSGVVASN